MKKRYFTGLVAAAVLAAVFTLSGCDGISGQETPTPVDYGELVTGKRVMLLNETGSAVIQLRLYSQKNDKWFTDVLDEDIWETGLTYELMLDAYENDVWKIEVTYTNGRLRTVEDLKLMEYDEVIIEERTHTAA